MNLVEEIKSYIDEKGFVTIDKNPGPNTTGNGFLHLAFLCAVLSQTGQRTFFKDSVEKTIEESAVPMWPGLFHRNPWKLATELNSVDEYEAIAALSKMYGFNFAERICLHGDMNRWVFDNQDPKSSNLVSAAWHGRFLGTVSFYRFCADKSLSPIEIIELCTVILLACFSRKADTCMRNYVRTEVLKNGNLALSLVSKFWRWQARKKFGTLGVMVKPYFGETHVFSFLPWI